MRRRVLPRHARGVLTWTICLLLLLASVAAPAWAQDDASADWEATSLRGKVEQLLAPADGVLLAWTGKTLHRSPDGRTWETIETPRQFFQRIAVDPTDSTLVYMIGEGGSSSPYMLYRRAPASRADGALTWGVVQALYFDWANGGSVVAVSPADPTEIFMYLPGRLNAPGTLYRSRDGGAYWTDLGAIGPPNTCISRDTLILAPHPTDYRRLFRAQSCRDASDTSTPLQVSLDRGATWTTSFDPTPRGAFPVRLVGGQGAASQRLYLAATNWRPRVPPEAADQTWLFRSDDDGQSWTEIGAWSGATGELGEPGGLAYDPAQPDRVYLVPGGSTVLASNDGGETWSPLGRQDLPRVNDLALSVDGTTLFAATDQGVFRLDLP